MRAELKDIHSPDVELNKFFPENPEHFAIFVQLFIGLEGESGSDTFDSYLCSPSGLVELLKDQDILIGRTLIIAREYDYEAVRSRIAKYCSRTLSDTWTEIAQKLLRLGHWEFENYKSCEE